MAIRKQIHSAAGRPVFANITGSQEWFAVFGLRAGRSKVEVKRANGRYVQVDSVTLEALELFRLMKAGRS
jgi:hypothetical protein